jgi:ribosomal protein S6E (S10)
MLNVKTLTDTMSRMELPQLQQYATLHKNDPYIVTLALSIANQKKQMKAAQDGQAGMQPQPKVVDQDIFGIPLEPQPRGAVPPQQMAQAMPEDQGIGTLPAPNMQNMAGGGIVAFDDGGEVPGYAEGVLTKAKKKYKEMKGYEFEGGPELFEKALDAEGIRDPKQRAFLKAIHAQESEQALNAPTREKSNAMGPMQVTKKAWIDVSTKGDELKNRADPFENMRAGIRYASTGWQKSGGDPVLAGAYYYGGPGGFAKAQKGEAVAASEDKGQTTFQYGKQVASRMPSMIPFVGAAQATPTTQDQGLAALAGGDPMTGFTMPQDVFSPSPEEERKYAAAQAQAKKVGDVVSQIPGQSVKAPAFKDTNTYFGGVADRAGIPLQVQRDIANTINATSGFTAPIGGINRAASTVSKGLEPTAEMLQKAEQAKLLTTSDLTKKIVEAPRIPFSAKPGLEGLDEASAATRAAAEQARRMRQLEQDRKAAVGAEQSVEAATKSANIADKTAKEIALAQDAARLNQAKMTGAAQGLAMTQAADKAGLFPQGGTDGAGIAALTPNENIKESVFDPTFGGTLPPDVKKDIVNKLKETTGATTGELKKQAADSGMDYNSFLTRLGFGLMAGESQYASVNLGKAGLGALDAQLAEQKSRQAQAASASESELKKMQARYYGTYADAIERGAKEKNEVLQAETLVQQHMEKWLSSSPGLIATANDPNATAKEEARVRKALYLQLGLNPIMSSNTPAGGAKFLGFENPA